MHTIHIHIQGRAIPYITGFATLSEAQAIAEDLTQQTHDTLYTAI